MAPRRAALILTLLAAPLLGAEGPPRARGRVALAPCRLPGMEGDALCGTLEVPERRDAPSGRRITLRLAVLTARGPHARPDPVFVVAGGPGQSAVNIAAQVAQEMEATLAEREVVLVDQRGSGGSNRLECRQFADDDMRRYLSRGFDLDALRRCRADLEKRADLTAYTTDAAVADLEDVRAAMGYERIDLDGGSYGTRVVLWYLKRHPARVRTAVLRGVSPTDYALPLPFARAGQEALERLFADCAGERACNTAFPGLRDEFAALLERLGRGPVEVDVKNPVTGAVQKAVIDREIFVTRVHLLLFSSRLSTRLPALLHQAAAGEWAPFAQLAADFGRAIVEQIDLGLQLSVACAEDAPRLRAADIDAATRGTFLGRGRVDQLLAACAVWPAAPTPAGFYDPVRSDVPALVVSGELDPVTPPRFGAQVARGLRHGWHAVIANGSHVDGGPCVDGLVTAFVRAGSADGLRPDCFGLGVRPPFVLPDPAPSAASPTP